MGTRNLVCIQKDNELKVAKYCQWDGYPDGQGKTVIEFVADVLDKKKLVRKLDNITEITDNELEKLWDEVGAINGSATMDVSNKFKKRYPHLQRDMGGEILEHVQESKGELKLTNSKSFAYDSLFCEYAYVLNLDEDTVDFFVGFNKDKPESSIFFDKDKDKIHKPDHRGDTYYPIRKVESFTFDEIKNRGVKEIVQKMKDPEDEDE